MRTSVMSRSLIALAGLAVASVALAAPSSAASSDITRAQILHAVDMLRDEGNPFAVTPATNRALRTLANRACSVDHDREAAVSSFGLPVAPGSSADGLFVVSLIADPSSLLPSETPPAITGRYCVFGALATTGSSATLSGTAKLTTDSTKSYALSGDAYVTPARSFTTTLNSVPPFNLADLGFTATGNATTSTKTTTTKTVKTPKTKAQLKSAKKKYSQALASAKKAYDKALKKAGSNRSKKASAKKAYDKKKAAAKAAYKKRIATTKVVKVTTVKKTPTPFDVQASFPAPPAP